MNKKRDRRRDKAVRHVKATGAATVLPAPAAQQNEEWGEGKVGTEKVEKRQL